MKALAMAVVLGAYTVPTFATARAEPPPPASPGSVVTGNSGRLRLESERMINGCTPVQDQQRPIRDLSMTERLNLLTCLNAAAVQQLSTQLPQQISLTLRLDRVRSQDTQIIYEFTVTAPNPPANFPALAQAVAQRNACANADMRRVISLGGSYVYHFVDPDGRRLADAQADACQE